MSLIANGSRRTAESSCCWDQSAQIGSLVETSITMLVSTRIIVRVAPQKAHELVGRHAQIKRSADRGEAAFDRFLQGLPFGLQHDLPIGAERELDLRPWFDAEIIAHALWDRNLALARNPRHGNTYRLSGITISQGGAPDARFCDNAADLGFN